MSVLPAPIVHASVEIDGAGNTVANSAIGIASTSRTAPGVYLVNTTLRAPFSAVDVEIALLSSTLGLCYAVEVVSMTVFRVRVQNQAGAGVDASISFTLARRTIGLPA